MALTLSQSAALAALGIDATTVTWSDDAVPPREPVVPTRRSVAPEALDDQEWDLILSSGALPDEPSQAGAMPNRRLVGAVLAVLPAARQWTELDPATSSEAVRKRFARLAYLGVWQALATELADSSLSAERKAQLNSVAHRARSLVTAKDSPSVLKRFAKP